ncbi:ATP-binding protein [Nocardiopsis sp. NPDC060348]|uniref:ATP-binding protein n=1 Tax=Nocardiopsis sp. NPDC060348 TaxID=3347102 RepID=UPI00365F27A3
MTNTPRPGRPSYPVPAPDSPLGVFALGLRELREGAGSPSFQRMAEQARTLGLRVSATSLRNAASGEKPPTLATVTAFVRVCLSFTPGTGEEALADWRRRWERLTGESGNDGEKRADGVERAPLARWRKGNLPAETDSFVGRDGELTALAHRLERARLVTLTGIGGVGKSRLARRVAAQRAAAHRDGAWLVELAPVPDPGAVAWTVATALGVQEDDPSDAVAQLARPLRDRRMLLVLDNCEHVLAACARLVDALLGTAPGLTVLATSRRSLGTAGEHVWPVVPLTVPDGGTNGQAATNPAVRLFADRAAAAWPGFSLTGANIGDVAELCRHLEGLPLSIELAARWTRTLSPRQIREHFVDRHRLRASGPAGRVRHRSLDTVLDHSHDLCSAQQRILWSRMSVFSGPVTAEDVCEVAGFDPLEGDSVLTALDALIDQSVVVPVDTPTGRGYTLLETVRGYGRRRLVEAGEEPLLRERHQDWFMALAHRAYAHSYGPDQAFWLARLRTCINNIRLALDNACHDGTDPQQVQVTTADLWQYWMVTGRLAEGRSRLERALSLSSKPTYALCRALWACGYLAFVHGDHSVARNHAEQALKIALSVGHTESEYGARVLLALTTLGRGGLSRSLELARGAWSMTDRSGFMSQLCASVTGLAYTLQGRSEEGMTWLARAREMAERHGEVWHHSYNLWAMGLNLLLRGDLSASEHLRQALRLKASIGDRLGIPAVVETLAWYAQERGEDERAALLLSGAEALWGTTAPRLFRFEGLVTLHRGTHGRIREALGQERSEELMEQGRGLGFEEVVELAAGEEL